MDLLHCVIERKAPEIGIDREEPLISSAEVCQGTRGPIRVREVLKGPEKALDGHRGELFQPLHDGQLAVAEAYTSNEDVEAIRDKNGVKADEVRDRTEMFQG